MKKLIFTLSFFCLIFFSATQNASAQVNCLGGTTGGNQISRCDWISNCPTCQGYCGQFGGAYASCSCPSGQMSSSDCKCNTGYVITSCAQTGSPVVEATCTAEQGSCTQCGGTCGTGIYINTGTCLCTTYGAGTCSEVLGTRTFYCAYEGAAPSPTSGGPGPTSPPAPTSPPVPTATTAPSPTPTPAIVGSIYADPNDGTVAIGGGGMCVKSGAAPVGTTVANATIRAIKSSNGAISNGLISGSSYVITSGLVTGANDYAVNLALPTPAAGELVSYICSCPAGGNDYLCSYSNINANGTANFFVRQNNMANAWWQTFGGSVYAQYEIQTQIPVSTCDASGTCQSALIAGNGLDTAGFAVLGDGGVLKTTTDGSVAYVHAAGSRTSATGAYAIGVDPGQEDYDFFLGNVGNNTTNVTSLAELNNQIAAMSNDTTQVFTYTGVGDLTIDKNSATTPISLSGNKRVAVFVPTNLVFSNTSGSSTPQLTEVPVGSFLMFIVQGSITIDQTVGFTNPATDALTATPNLTGVFVADGHIIIQGDGDLDIADRKFIGAGTFVGWDRASNGNGVSLERSFQDIDGMADNAVNPAEVFVYRPDFLTNFPVELKVAHYNWREIAPQR